MFFSSHFYLETYFVTCGMWHVTYDRWHVTHDRWLVTYDMWHVLHDTWCGVNILSECQHPSSRGFGLMMLWTFGGKRKTQRFNYWVTKVFLNSPRYTGSINKNLNKKAIPIKGCFDIFPLVYFYLLLLFIFFFFKFWQAFLVICAF